MIRLSCLGAMSAVHPGCVKACMSQECADEIEKDFLCESLPPEFSHSLHPIEPLRLLPGDYRTGAKTGTR